MKTYSITLLLFINLVMILGAQSSPNATAEVDSLLSTMSVDDKIGQLFMIRAFSHNDAAQIALVKSQIKKYKPGGICFFQGSPSKQAKLTNDYQSLSKLPMLISIDGEWGLGMRFKKKAVSFPRQLTLGAIDDHNLIFEMGKEIAHQMKRIGIHINFAPVVDVNNNADNPVINDRSFGEDKNEVASRAYAYMKGLQSGGLSACLKHYPGHGDTDVDSHYDLPIIPHSRKRLDSLELAPFRSLMSRGVDGVMTAHLHVPAIDDRPNRPTSLSKNAIEDLVINQYKYEGLIYTDAMEMKGVTKHFTDGEADFEAFMAGNDVILLPENIAKGYEYIKAKYKEGIITDERLNRSVRKILLEKQKHGILRSTEKINTQNISEKTDDTKSHIIKEKIYEKSLTLVKNEAVLPLLKLKGKTFGSISLGSNELTSFQKRIKSYVNCENYFLPKKSSSQEYKTKVAKLSKKDYVIIGLHDMSKYAHKKFGITELEKQFIKEISKNTKVILTIFGSPYSLRYFEDMECVLIAYENDPIAQDVAMQAIFGAIDITGKLPVSGTVNYPAKTGIILPSIKRIGYSIPERVNLNSDTLRLIKGLMQKMIAEKASPGGQIIVARNNKVVYQENFGYQTYAKKKRIYDETIYDVASITKILASTLSAMHLNDNDSFSFQDSVSSYFSDENTTNKSDMVYADMMAHVSGLLGWIPFYKNTMKGDKRPKLSNKYYRSTPSDSFNIEVNDQLFMREDYVDTIWRQVFSSRKRDQEYIDENKYLYSDLAFYILNWTIERKTMLQVDDYAKQNFYDPIGLRNTSFNPLFNVAMDRIAPSEKDTYFRMDKVQGFVHDMGAAMLGGVSGHAGLFSNASEVAVLMQMLLNKGYYGGHRFISEKTIDRCTQRHPLSTRRAIGFDMKELDNNKNINMSELASNSAYGHLGFTGCAAFVDPEQDLVYVFLSNRTFPSMNNNKFGRNNYRPKVQSIIYRSLIQ